MATPLILSGSSEPVTSPLTANEEVMFRDSLEKLATIMSPHMDLSALLLEYAEEFKIACEVAKADTNGTFGGIDAAAGFGVTYIRPKIFGTSVNSINYETAYWRRYGLNTGWQNFWGASGSEVTMPSPPNNSVIAFPALIDYSDSPKIIEVSLWVEGKQYSIHNIKPWVSIGPALHIARLPGTVLLKTGGKFYMRVNLDSYGDVEIAPFGLQFSTSTYLRTE